MSLNIRYFAALKDKMGMAEEAIEAGPDMATGDDLIVWLQARDNTAEALAHPSVRMIINDEITPRSTPIKDGDTIAFCPPFSGG